MYRGNGNNGNGNGFLLSSVLSLPGQLCLNSSLGSGGAPSRGLDYQKGMGSVQSMSMDTVNMLNSKVSRSMQYAQSPLPASPQSPHTRDTPGKVGQLPLGFPLSPLSRNSAAPDAPTTPTAQELLSLQDQDDLEEEAKLLRELSSLQVPDENTFARWQAAHRNKILKDASVKLSSLKAAQSYVESRIDSDHAICNVVQHVPKLAEACKFFRMACGCTRTQCPYEHETTLKTYRYETRRKKVVDELIHGRTPEVRVDVEVKEPVQLSQQQMEAISLITGRSRKPDDIVKREPAAFLMRMQADVVQMKREPDFVQVKREPDYVQVMREPDFVQVKREPDYVQVKREPDMVQVKREPDYVQVKREPDVVYVKRELEIVQVKLEPGTEVKQESAERCDEDDASSMHSVNMEEEEDDGCFVVNFGGFPNERQRGTPTPPPEPSPKEPPRQEPRNEKIEHALAILQASRASMSTKQSQRDALDRQLEEFQKRVPTQGKRSRSEEGESQGSQRRKL